MDINNLNNNFHEISINIGNLQANFILQTGFFDITSEWVAKSHFHSYFEFHFILDGKSELIVDDKINLLEKNDFCIIPPGLNHYTKNIFLPTKKVSLLFNFKKQKTENTSDNDEYIIFYNNFMKIENTKIIKNSDAFNKYLKEIIELYNSKDIFKIYKIKALFILMIIDTSEKIASNPSDYDLNKNIVPASDNLRMVKIENYINNNFMNDITLKDLAAHLHLSERQAERSVKKLTSLSFGQFLNKTRLDRAKELVLSTEIPIHEISLNVGYRSYNGFYTSFKKMFGDSPSNLRD